jgi:hypothetical protein
MADYTKSKRAGASDGANQYLENSVATPWGRLEPLITPDVLKSRFLKGIPLTLKVKDPETGKPYRITDDELKDYIEVAVDEAEQETHLVLMPTQFEEKLPYQRQDYDAFGYFQLSHKPVASIEALTVKLADNHEIFNFPLEWIETSNLIHGQVNILPLANTGINQPVAAGSGTAVFFNNLWNRPWVSALFGVKYTAGFKDGLMPRSVNQLIGIIAAMQVLSQIAAAYAGQTSASLGLDGMSQSTSTPGPNRYQVRMQELKEQRIMLVKKIRKGYGSKFIFGTV